MLEEKCHHEHDAFAAVLASGLAVGLIISYLPQHLRIINKKSSEGISAWFLLLGSTSSAAGMLNVITMQWGIIKCCPVVGPGNCLESLGGVIQVGLQWLLFSMILILYLIYFPPHLKYVEVHGGHLEPSQKIKTSEWTLAIRLAWVVAVHLALITFVTFLLIVPSTAIPQRIAIWATFLGVSSALLAVIQYAPQLLKTYQAGTVGALSIPMMCIQTPGAILMVTSIAIRPGTNWTSWITYATAGIMQGSLLVMCLVWKARQKRLGIDDFGRPLDGQTQSITSVSTGPVDERTPLVPPKAESVSRGWLASFFKWR